jgi:hypothetical protein
VYSKTKADGLKKPVGSIDLKEVYAVNEPIDDTAPENSLELITANRISLLVAESEADQMAWIDAVGDRLEDRKAAAREDAFELALSLPRPQKIDAMKRSTQFSGILVKKMNNGSWKERYFVLANRCLTYYDYEESFYNDYKDSLGVIHLSDIVQVNSSQLAKCINTGFDVHARSSRGQRDEKGVRVYTFNAHIDSLCVQWMSAIVENIGGLQLKQISRPDDESPFFVSARLDHNSARIASIRASPLIDLSTPRSPASTSASASDSASDSDSTNTNIIVTDSDKIDSSTINSSTSSTSSAVTGSMPAHLRLSKMFPTKTTAGSGKPSPMMHSVRAAAGSMTAVVTMTRNNASCPFLATVKENQSRSRSASAASSRPNSATSPSLFSLSNNHGVPVNEADILKKLADEDQS